MKTAIVREIQVCGGRIVDSLEDACRAYLKCLSEDIDREKLHFDIKLPNGDTKSITIRQDGDRIVAYGDFVELPNILEWVKEATK